MVIRQVVSTGPFERAVCGIRDAGVKERVKKQIEKIVADPEAGKPLRYGRRGERRLRVGPYCILYAVKGDILYLLDFRHREGGY